MGHLDVVGVQKEKWSVDPFAALRLAARLPSLRV